MTLTLNHPLKAHPLADIFPMIPDEERPALRADIEKNGLLDQVIMLDGLILDGRNRYRELQELGWETDPSYYADFNALGYVNADGEPLSPLDYVISKNENRRHLNESQRAMSAARAANMRQGERSDLKPLPTDPEPSANLRKVSQGEAATKFKVSERLVSSATRVMKTGVPALQNLVDQGQVTVSIAEEIARMPEEDQTRIVTENKPAALKTAAKRVARDRRLGELAQKQRDLPIKKYGVIYADPGWHFATRSEGGRDKSPKYTTEPLEKIMAMRVGDIAADDCVLFMWATVPMLIEAICVADAWGFCLINRDKQSGFLMPDKAHARYVTNWDWVKDKIITGYWGRGKHEHLLIFTRGKPVAPAPGTQPASVLDGPEAFDDQMVANAPPWSDEHSAKPDLFAEWIEKLFQGIAKIELNARQARGPEWDIWGNQAPEEESPDSVAGKTAELAAGLPPRVESTPEEIAARREERRQRNAADDEAWEAAAPDADIDTRTLGDVMEADVEALDTRTIGEEPMPPMVTYDGKHTDETDALIRYGYAHKKPIVLICAWLGLPEKKKGIVKGRANRLGLTDPARIIEVNKARAKGSNNG